MNQLLDVKEIVESFCPFVKSCKDYCLKNCNDCSDFYDDQVIARMNARKEKQ